MIRDEETGRSGGGQLSSNLSQFGGASGDNTARLSSYGIVIARIHEHDNRFQPVDEILSTVITRKIVFLHSLRFDRLDSGINSWLNSRRFIARKSKYFFLNQRSFHSRLSRIFLEEIRSCASICCVKNVFIYLQLSLTYTKIVKG